ncbi:hypothetical protein [Bosea sp. (in: a-proteobacteria)]|uniref:hypothetical protein n=1 Tax=Bosea sp. (in: a-proteobacteria) TaxID=1871050 RepID=UPI003F700B60
MILNYRWVKNADGALDVDFVVSLARHFGITAFLETGTYRGDTLATVRGVFSRLVSIELSTEFALAAQNRFASDPAIEIIQADSAQGLERAFDAIGDAPALIWLDAHYSGGPTAKGDGNTPILAEVSQILERRSGLDIVLIDDARLFWPHPAGFLAHETLSGYPMLSDVAEKFLDADGRYDVFFFGDALAAFPKGQIEPSAALLACTRCRLSEPGTPVDQGAEAAICSAHAAERDALVEVAPLIESQREYGLGGHYFYWRGLLRESEGNFAGATADFAFAAQCGVIPPDRTGVAAS